MKEIDLINKRFGRLIVIGRGGVLSNGNENLKAWECVCDCGNKIIIRGRCLSTGNTKSCGCYQKEIRLISKKTHGLSKTPVYRLWADIKKRAYGKGSERHRRFYKNISICEEWNIFENFYYWARNNWRKGLDIDRIDTTKNYSPDNCRFVTRKINAQNKKNCKIWFINGKIFQSSGDAAKYLGCSQSHIYFMCHGRKTETKYYPPKKGCYVKYKYANSN